MRSLNVSYKEEQVFSQWWFKLLLIASAVLGLYTGIHVLLFEDSLTGKIITWAALLPSLIILFMVMRWKLKTDINNYGINMTCPFAKKKIAWDKIEKLEVIDYGFVGYGIRYGGKHGTVYNTSGKMGLVVKPKGKKQFVIGTQRPDDLNKIVEKWKNTSS